MPVQSGLKSFTWAASPRRKMETILLKCLYLNPRKKMFAIMLVFCVITLTMIVFNCTRSAIAREESMEEFIAVMKNRIQFFEAQYREKLEDLMISQGKSFGDMNYTLRTDIGPTYSPEVIALLENISGSKAAEAAQVMPTPETIRAPFSVQLMPHLLKDSHSLKIAYKMSGGRSYADVVIGIPTVKRDKESYLLFTLGRLIEGLDEQYESRTLIVVMVGEKDLNYVITVARTIELTYPTQVHSGLIEVIAPNAAYYPNFDEIPLSLGDSRKRVAWRTKQNLDVIYLMAYAKTKGLYYLMLEDDVIAKAGYMHAILTFAGKASVAKTPWFFINFSTIGGIGKLFKSADLNHFISYVELFYANMPIDWLLESYLGDRICGINRVSKTCGELKAKIRPTYNVGQFQHIGLYSSLKGKMQMIKTKHFGIVPPFYPHKNPDVEKIICTIVPSKKHVIERAYAGKDYFWGIRPKKGDVIEFWFKKPENVERFLFRTGNLDHPNDKFQDTVVEILSAKQGSKFTVVSSFDEFGLADGEIDRSLLPLSALRIRVDGPEERRNLWVVLVEIEISTAENEAES